MDSVERMLDQVARKGSWMGGGSVVALTTAFAAALLEKLTAAARPAERLRRIRRDCLGLVERDAAAFARVIEATRSNDLRQFARCLKAATEIPYRLVRHAAGIQAACRMVERAISPRFRSDLRCAQALARCADASARALIAANLDWLNDAAYAKVMRRRLTLIAHRHVD